MAYQPHMASKSSGVILQLRHSMCVCHPPQSHTYANTHTHMLTKPLCLTITTAPLGTHNTFDHGCLSRGRSISNAWPKVVSCIHIYHLSGHACAPASMQVVFAAGHLQFTDAKGAAAWAWDKFCGGKAQSHAGAGHEVEKKLGENWGALSHADAVHEIQDKTEG
eukprot:scaffold82395_cov19-Tisochrysis_lutea.AAC.2